MNLKDIQGEFMESITDFNKAVEYVLFNFRCVNTGLRLDGEAKKAIAERAEDAFRNMEIKCIKLGVEFGRGAERISDIINRETG